jgi:acetyl-CoA carboxylase biotin carboxyl carrier protein
MSSEPISLQDIENIIKLIREAENVAEFSLKYGDLEISLSRNVTPRFGPESPPSPRSGESHNLADESAAKPAMAKGGEHEPPRGSEDSQPREGEIAIKAPMVGTFYRSPKPGDPPFVDEGTTVSADSIVCIIEVMKLMNSLHAGVEGVVTRILVQDAQPVEYGQPLMFVRKNAS